MPKEGLSDTEWKERLQKFSQGVFKFGRGQRPPKNSVRGTNNFSKLRNVHGKAILATLVFLARKSRVHMASIRYDIIAGPVPVVYRY